jgi:hypothetical protein
MNTLAPSQSSVSTAALLITLRSASTTIAFRMLDPIISGSVIIIMTKIQIIGRPHGFTATRAGLADGHRQEHCSNSLVRLSISSLDSSTATRHYDLFQDQIGHPYPETRVADYRAG